MSDLTETKTTTQPTQPGAVPGATPQTALTGAAQNMVLIPVQRLGAILVAAQKARLADVKKQIQMFDQLPTDTTHPVAFKLKNASAFRVTQALNVFYLNRYSPPDVNQIRFSWDDRTNTVGQYAAK